MAALALGGSASGQTLAILHSFAGVSDGAYPAAALVQATDGNFYGTAQRGETYSDGTVFRIAANGSFTNLYSFNGNDGSYPQSALVQGNDGNLYGTTSQGGAGYGFVFRITPSGVLTNLHAFFNYPPSGGVVQGSDGYFYGEWGGCVYQISSSGSFTNLYCPPVMQLGVLSKAATDISTERLRTEGRVTTAPCFGLVRVVVHRIFTPSPAVMAPIRRPRSCRVATAISTVRHPVEGRTEAVQCSGLVRAAT